MDIESFKITDLKESAVTEDVTHVYEGQIPICAVYLHQGTLLFKNKKEELEFTEKKIYFAEEMLLGHKSNYEVIIKKGSIISNIGKSIILRM